jgi:hypothetical protein
MWKKKKREMTWVTLLCCFKLLLGMEQLASGHSDLGRESMLSNPVSLSLSFSLSACIARTRTHAVAAVVSRVANFESLILIGKWVLPQARCNRDRSTLAAAYQCLPNVSIYEIFPFNGSKEIIHAQSSSVAKLCVVNHFYFAID